MKQIKQLSNGHFVIGRDNGQPLMNLAMIIDSLVYLGTPMNFFPLLPLLNSEENEGNPYRLMQSVMSEISRQSPLQNCDVNSRDQKKLIESTINMGFAHIALYDRKYYIHYLCKKEEKFKHKFMNVSSQATNDYNARCVFLYRNKIKIPSQSAINYVNTDELYDSDAEYTETNPPKSHLYDLARKMKKSHDYCIIENPAEGLRSLLSGNEEKASSIDNHHSEMIKKCQSLLIELNYRRNTHPRIQYMICAASQLILTVHLTGIYPQIWRRIRVPARLSLRIFHEKVLCVIFGYKRNFHSYLFLEPHRKNKKIGYGPWQVSSADNIHQLPVKEICMDDRAAYLFDFFVKEGSQLRYIYDLGDQYHHTITLEKLTSLNEPLIKQVYSIKDTDIIPTKIRWKYEMKPLVQIIDGSRHGPLENMRGNKGYVRRLNILQKGIDTSLVNDRHSIEKESLTLFDIVWEIKTSPNMDKKLFDSERFDVRECQTKIKEVFSKPMIKNDLRHFVHPARNIDMIPNDKAYRNVLKCIRSKHMIGIRGVRTCYYGHCRKRQYKMKCCKACKSAFYCSRKCQKKDWLQHSVMCFESNRF